MITIKRSFRPGRGLIRPEELSGYVFSPEAGAHTFIITKMEKVDGQETAVPFAAGTDISCRFVKADGVTELVDGSLTDDGEASVTLSAECYQVPGRFILFVFAENGDENVCIYSATATALAGDTEEINVSGNTKRTIDAQIAALNDAVENAQETVEQVQDVIDSIPQDYTALSDSVSDLKSAVDNVTENTTNLWPYGDQEFVKNKSLQPFDLPAGTYTLSAVINSTGVTRARFYAFYEDSESVNAIIDASGERASATITFARKVTRIRIDAATTASASTGVESVWCDIQLELGGEATAYKKPVTAIDYTARGLADDIEALEASIEENDKTKMTKLSLSGDDVSLFMSRDGFKYWGGWANPSLFTENLPDQSNLNAVSHFLSFGSGEYTRGVIGVQRSPLALGVYSKESADGPLLAGTAKLTPWKKSIAFFGDSIMWGRDGDISAVTQASRTIPTYCGMALGCIVRNRGVGSQGWIATGSNRNALQELQNYSNLANENVIVLCWGVNDLSGYTVGDWQNPDSDTIMYQVGLCVDYIYSVNPTATIVIVAPWNSPSYGEAPKYKYGITKWQSMDSALRNYCEYWGIPYIDQHDSPFNGKNMTAFFSTTTTDRVHPTQTGYEKLGNWLAAKLSAII